MHTPNNPFEEEDQSEPRPRLPAPDSLDAPGKPAVSTTTLSGLKLLQAWMATLVIPVPVTLGALVLTAFLLFPAYKGLTSGSTIAQLEQANRELRQQKEATQSRATGLERELAERDLRLTQRQTQSSADTSSGLYLSPLLYLESKRSGAPDLINIDFSQADQAILVFSLPKLVLRDVEISIFQDTSLVWNQSIAIPQQKLFGENLVTLLLTSSALVKGNYKMTVQGNPTAQRIMLSQFDVTIEG